MARTILTKAQQEKFLDDNWQLKTLRHKWSTRGYGSSRFVDSRDNVLGKASGCGYDRRGTALGKVIEELFPDEVLKLAKRECKGRRRTYKQAPNFYGLFYDSTEKRAWLDGGVGDNCMKKILAKIGFSLLWVGESGKGQSGEEFYTLEPVTKSDRRWL